MLFEYTEEPGWILRPQSQEEQRWGTILRDLALDPNVRMRFVGSENLEKDLLGLPPRPVIAFRLVLETVDGTPIRDYIRKNYPANPNIPTPATVANETGALVGRGDGKNVTFVRHVQRDGETSVVQERR